MRMTIVPKFQCRFNFQQ